MRIAVLILSSCLVSCLPNWAIAYDATRRDVWDYVFIDPPDVFVVFWTLAPCLTLASIVISAHNIRRHMAAAQQAGFLWARGVSPSFGPRADRIICLLCLPPTFALTGLMQVYLPGTAVVAELIRTVEFSLATIRTVELMYLLIGGREILEGAIPEAPIKVFNQMPCCCIWGWPCCARRATLADLRMMVLGMKQYVYVAPFISLFEVMLDSHMQASLVCTTSLTVCFALSTMIGMWSFNSMLAMFDRAVKRARAQFNFSATGCFVIAHLLLSKTIGLGLRLGVQEDFDNTIWIMPMEHYSSMISGFVLCAAEALLSLYALKVFGGLGPMLEYPPCDKEHGYPVDLVAQLELDGIDVRSWASLRALTQGVHPVNQQDGSRAYGSRTNPTGEA